MLMIGFASLVLALYLGLVIGTYKKFQYNGINFGGKIKLIFPFFPFVLIILHLYWGLKGLFVGNKNSSHIFKMILIKYPIVIGMLIEIILENAAYHISDRKNVVRMRKKRNRKKIIRKKKNLDFYQVPKPSSRKRIFTAYKNSLSNTAI